MVLSGRRGVSKTSVARPAGRLPNLEGWIRQSPEAAETLRRLVERPAGNAVSDLERTTGDPTQVVRTLHQLQNAGLVRIQIEAITHELVARVPEMKLEELRDLLAKLDAPGWNLPGQLGQGAKSPPAK